MKRMEFDGDATTTPRLIGWRFGSRLGIPPLGSYWVYTTTWENARWKLGICSGGYRFGSFALWSCGYDYSTASRNGWMIQPIPFVQSANHLFPLNATPHRKEVSLWNIQDICNFHEEAPRFHDGFMWYVALSTLPRLLHFEFAQGTITWPWSKHQMNLSHLNFA